MVDRIWALARVTENMAAWNRRDWSALDSLYTDSVVYESPHSFVVGRDAVRARYEELIAVAPDLRSSELRLVDNDRIQHHATFEFVQRGTLTADSNRPLHVVGSASRFTVHTKMFVRFNQDGRIAALRTVHAQD